MYCVLDIERFHRDLVTADGNVRAAAAAYYNTDDQWLAIKCLGADVTSGNREAFAMTGYLQNMSFRGCSPDRIARFLHRFAERISHDRRMPETGWRAYSFMRYGTRVRWEGYAGAKLRAL